MKKYVAIILALVMVLALAACGGSDKSELTKAYNDAANAYNEVATLANENGWNANEEINSTLTGIAGKLEKYKAIVTGSDKITDEDMASYIEDLKALLPIMEEFKTTVANPFEAEASDAAEAPAGVDLTGTAWAFNGGMNPEGVEMTQEELDAVVAEQGVFGYTFGEDMTMAVVANDQEIQGTYEVAEDGTIVLNYSDASLQAALMNVDGRPVLMVTFPDGYIYYFAQ